MPDKGQIFESKSWDPAGDTGRDKKLRAVVEEAGGEVAKPEAELSALPEVHEKLTPEQADECVRAYSKKVEQAKEEYGDFEDLHQKYKANDIEIGKQTQNAIVQLDNGPDVTLWLMRNPGRAEELGKLCKKGRGEEAVTEVKKLSARLAQQRRPAQPSENASVERIAAMPNFWGKARRIQRALNRRWR